MYLLVSLLKDFFVNISEIVTESEINQLKKNDERVYLQFDELLALNNGRRCFLFSVLQLIFGILFFVFALLAEKESKNGVLFEIIGSVVMVVSSVFFILIYKSEFDKRKHDVLKLKIFFYIFWNLYTIGGFFITAGIYHRLGTVYVFLLFCIIFLAVPVFRITENLIASAVYLVPMVYYGVQVKSTAGFYVCAVFIVFIAFLLNAYKTDYFFKEWKNERKLREALIRCKNISQIDNLTGLLNRAGLSAKIKERYSKNADSHKISMVMVNVDNFRIYNHQYGYDKSDDCLHNICNCIRIISKPVTDIVARFCGDNFILVLEDMDEIEIVKFAEQIRLAVETMAIPFGDKGVITISIGISSIAEFKEDTVYSKLLNEADIQLMIAKNSGKNCIGYRNRAFIQENRR